MDTLLQLHSSVAFLTPNHLNRIGSSGNQTFRFLFLSNGFSSSSSSLSPNSSQRVSVIVGAKKNRKEDTHHFAPKPDEATGPFPESVLFKEKKVEKDGKLVPEFADAEEEKIYEVLKLQLENDLQEEQRLRHYEVVYLIHEKHAEEVESVNAKVNDFLREKRGTIWRISDWGMRRLAYKIQKAKNAHYILMNFEMDAKWINDFKSMLDKDERVIRHLVIKRDEAITEDCPPPPEFHSMRSGMDDDDDEDLEIDDEEYDEDWDAEGEFEDDDGIIVVSDEDEEDRTSRSDAKSKTSKLKAEKENSLYKAELEPRRRTMATTTSTNILALLLMFLIVVIIPKCECSDNYGSVPNSDVDLLEFPLNLEYLEAEFFLFGALGYGLDKVAPNLSKGGPPPIGAKKANLDSLTKDIILQFGWQEVGHLRAIQNTVKGFPRPLLNLSSSSFAQVMDSAFGRKLRPPFDPYLVGGLLGVESGQDAVIRALLYERAMTKVKPYGITVADFTNRISDLRNQLGHGGLKDEGLVVPPFQGAEGRVAGNVLAGDRYSLSYGRTPEEILRIVYGGNGDEHVVGGFYPKGANESMRATTPIFALMLILLLLLPKSLAENNYGTSVPKSDVDLLEFPLNLEFFEAEFFLYGALGYGLDKVAPKLTKGGPPPIGATKANLDTLTKDVILQFGLQEVGHLRAIQKTVKGFPRPLLNLSSSSFANVIDSQDAVIRAMLYERRKMIVKPYNINVAEFTNQISKLRNKLGKVGLKDEGLMVPTSLGAEGRVSGNVLSANQDSLSYGRTPMEILRIVYGSGNEHVPGGFYPKGGS
ncbi:hypothetical protein G4B88_003850 [Cannabis sativa]|uniref:Desiccation-related protein PCC13-62 n=1 Tax=Cannabis sativa TaxID=3483 RepID=A0A7J6FNN9_CANSA|nr:hypothetical protein G4B88_003850 [Cannabis sativa]